MIKHFLLIFAGFAGFALAILMAALLGAAPAPTTKKASLGDIECDSLTIYGANRKNKLSIVTSDTGIYFRMGRKNGPTIVMASHENEVWMGIEGVAEKDSVVVPEICTVGRGKDVYMQLRGAEGFFYVQPDGFLKLK